MGIRMGRMQLKVSLFTGRILMCYMKKVPVIDKCSERKKLFSWQSQWVLLDEL